MVVADAFLSGDAAGDHRSCFSGAEIGAEAIAVIGFFSDHDLAGRALFEELIRGCEVADIAGREMQRYRSAQQVSHDVYFGGLAAA